MLRRLATEGLARRYGDPPPAEAVERLEFELGVIGEMGFDSYFLIVWDFVKFAKDNGIAVGPGPRLGGRLDRRLRLNITDLDPLANELLFERFLNPARKSMPDIDIDFSVRGRERVIRYVAEKYGRESVAQIITFGKMAPRAATRDAARVLGFDYATGDRVAKQIPEPVLGRNPSFEDCLKPRARSSKRDLRRRRRRAADPRRRAGPRGHRPQQLDPRRGGGDRRPPAGRDRAAPARRGPQRRRPGTATAARTGKPERSYKIVTQYSMGPIEEIGLLKMDFLGLAEPGRDRGRGRDHRALPRGRDRHRGDPARRREDLRDALARRLGRGLPARVGRHARRARAGCDRPSSTTSSRSSRSTGPGAMRYIDDYARGKRDPSSVRYADERLRPITESTYGCCIYQEQLMEIAKQMAGFSPAEADDLRKAVGKKKRDLMATMEDKFVAGLRGVGHRRTVAKDLWSLMTAAADYSFNKSHAACYALIAYRTAYLKANYPAEYMAAVISSVMSTKDKVPFFVNRCEEMGIEVLPPDVNSSDHGFVVSGKSIRFGLDAVKNVGHAAVEAILERPRARRPVRVDLGLLRAGRRAGGQQARRSSAWSSAVRSTPRATPARGCSRCWRRRQASAQKAQEDARRGQGSIFDLGGEPAQARRGRQRARAASARRSRARSSTSASCCASRRRRWAPSSPRTRWARSATRCGSGSTAALADVAGQGGRRLGDGRRDRQRGKKVRTRSGAYVMFATLDDLEGRVELFVRDAAGEAAEADRARPGDPGPRPRGPQGARRDEPRGRRGRAVRARRGRAGGGAGEGQGPRPRADRAAGRRRRVRPPARRGAEVAVPDASPASARCCSRWRRARERAGCVSAATTASTPSPALRAELDQLLGPRALAA